MTPLVWLITGCSSGLGEAFAEVVLERGDKVIATARGDVKTRLSSLEKLGAAVLELDVTSPGETLRRKVDEAVQIYGHIDVLFNNAGYVEGGIFEEADDDKLLRQLQVNTLGPLTLTRAVLGHMRPRRSGTIIFNCSMGTYMRMPYGSFYTTSKAALETAAISIAQEVSPLGIRVCNLVTGEFKTNVYYAQKHDSARKIDEYNPSRDFLEGYIATHRDTQRGDPRKAASIVVDAVHGEGVAQGKTLPLSLPLGPDALETMRETCAFKMAACEEWGAVISQTDLDGYEASS